jgi:hypothetical protein
MSLLSGLVACRGKVLEPPSRDCGLSRSARILVKAKDSANAKFLSRVGVALRSLNVSFLSSHRLP